MTTEAQKTFAAAELEAANAEIAAEVAAIEAHFKAHPDLSGQARFEIVRSAQERSWQRATHAIVAGIAAMRGASP